MTSGSLLYNSNVSRIWDVPVNAKQTCTKTNSNCVLAGDTAYEYFMWPTAVIMIGKRHVKSELLTTIKNFWTNSGER